MRHTGKKTAARHLLTSFPPLVTLVRLIPNDFNSQAPPAQTILQTSQDSVTHSAVQMRCSGSSLVVRIPSPASLVRDSTGFRYRLCLCCSSNLRQQREFSVPGSLSNSPSFPSFLSFRWLLIFWWAILSSWTQSFLLLSLGRRWALTLSVVKLLIIEQAAALT